MMAHMSRAVIVTMVIQFARLTTIDMAASDITTRDSVDRVDNMMDRVDLERASTVVNYGRDDRFVRVTITMARLRDQTVPNLRY